MNTTALATLAVMFIIGAVVLVRRPTSERSLDSLVEMPETPVVRSAVLGNRTRSTERGPTRSRLALVGWVALGLAIVFAIKLLVVMVLLRDMPRD